MKHMQQTILTSQELDSLILSLSNLIFKCSDIINEISTDPMVFTKDVQNDPVTSADYLIQLTIAQHLKKFCPSLRIVGEETLSQQNPQYLKVIDNSKNIQSFQLEKKYILNQLPFKIKQQNQYLTEKLAVWIDPLDCTRGFVANHKQQVTILIGISYQHQPIIGIIGHPYKLVQSNNKDSHSYVFDPSVTIGTTQSFIQAAFEFNLKGNLWKTHKINFLLNNSNIVAISSRRESQVQKKIISEVNLTSKRAGGAGNKILMLVRRQVDTVMFIDVQTSKWDSCAGEAIILGMGGKTMKPNMSCIKYDPNEQHLNRQGFIFSLNKDIFGQIQKVLMNQITN